MSRELLKWLAAGLSAVALAAIGAISDYVTASPLVTGNPAADNVITIALTAAIVRLSTWLVSKVPA
jgi:hypothetical protein